MTLSKLIKIVLEYMDEKGMVDDLKNKYRGDRRKKKQTYRRNYRKNG